jgi:hypothetical protein
MKRQIILILILILFIAGLIFGIIYLTNPHLFSSASDDNNDKPQDQIQIIKYPIQEGEIVHTYEIDAQVISGAPEIYTTEIRVDGITDSNFSLLKNKGDLVSPAEVFYKYKNKDCSVDFNGLIVDIIYEQLESSKAVIIKLLNYDNLFISANIDIDKIDRINYDTPVKVIYNGSESEAKIITIGYEILDKKLPVSISLPEKMYPGTPVKLIFTLGVQKAGLYVLEDAIYQDGENYFADIENGTETKQVKLTIGQRFSVEEGEVVFKYIEILSGVSKDDMIIVEKIDSLGSQIKESLNNE